MFIKCYINIIKQIAEDKYEYRWQNFRNRELYKKNTTCICEQAERKFR